MKLKEIIEFLDEKIPPSLALPSDEVGFRKEYDLNQEITSIDSYMDLLPENDVYCENKLIITHHPPLFVAKTPTYTVHSKWDIIEGGANDALADTLNLEVIEAFDESTNIGRVCRTEQEFGELKKTILEKFTSVRVANDMDDAKIIRKVGVISGFGLKNPEYIDLAKEKNLDVLISGDLTHQTAILAKNLDITLIDLNHHESEVPGLYALADILKELDIDINVIDRKPIDVIK